MKRYMLLVILVIALLTACDAKSDPPTVSDPSVAADTTTVTTASTTTEPTETTSIAEETTSTQETISAQETTTTTETVITPSAPPSPTPQPVSPSPTPPPVSSTPTQAPPSPTQTPPSQAPTPTPTPKPTEKPTPTPKPTYTEADYAEIISTIRAYGEAKGFIWNDSFAFEQNGKLGYYGRPNLTTLSKAGVITDLKFNCDTIEREVGICYFKVVQYLYEGNVEFIVLYG